MDYKRADARPPETVGEPVVKISLVQRKKD
jgi:hypothetical protein